MRRAFTFLGLATAILLFITGMLHFLFKFTPAYPVQKLEKGWIVIYHNEQYVNTNLEHLSTLLDATFAKGDTITLNLEKPIDYSGLPFPYLVLKTPYCGYQIFIDGKLIAEKNTNNDFKDVFVGITYNPIALPLEMSGGKLSIKLFVSENNTHVDIVTPIIGNYEDVYRQILHAALYPAFTGIFMIIFGIIFLIISLVFYVRTSGVAPQVLTSLLSIALGMWMTSAYNCFDFALSPSVATTIEFVSMYSLLPLIYLLISSLHKRYNNMVLLFLAYSGFAFALIFIVFHVLDIVHINHFQQPYYFMTILGIIMLFIYDYMDFRLKIKSSSTIILMFGLTVLAVALIFYVIIEIFQSVIDYRQNMILCFLVPSGCIFFVIAQLLNHFIFMTRSFAKRNEYMSLTKIAYVDNLTGVPNRASCDARLSEIDKLDTDFCILSLDLNGLKEVNDNSGHPAGDRLLKSFATTLLDTFKGKGDCFRVGGDEFIVVFEHIEKDELEGLLKTLEARLKKLDEEDSEINHSVSYGYSYRNDTLEKDTHSVMMLADAKMYDFKRNFYSHMMR